MPVSQNVPIEKHVAPPPRMMRWLFRNMTEDPTMSGHLSVVSPDGADKSICNPPERDTNATS